MELCDEKIGVLKNAILGFEQEEITAFLSHIEACRVGLADAETRIAAFPEEPSCRLGPMSRLQRELEQQNTRLIDLHSSLRQHGLLERITQSDMEIQRLLSVCIDDCSEEVRKLNLYLTTFNQFQASTSSIESYILHLPDAQRFRFHQRGRRENLCEYGRIAIQLSEDLRELCRRANSARDCGRGLGLDIGSMINMTTNNLKEELNRTLRYIRCLVDEITPPRNDVELREAPEERTFEDMWSSPSDPPPVMFKVNRFNIMEEFIQFAIASSGQYRNDRPRVFFKGEAGIDAGGPTREVFTLVSDELFRAMLVTAGTGDMLWLPRNEKCDSKRVQGLIAVGFLIRWAIQKNEPITALLPLPFFGMLKSERMTKKELRVISPQTADNIDAARIYYKRNENIGLTLEDGRDVTDELFEEYE
jgi:hypothetical protein